MELTQSRVGVAVEQWVRGRASELEGRGAPDVPTYRLCDLSLVICKMEVIVRCGL